MNMIGINSIGVYIPDHKISNLELTEKFGVTEDFIKEKIGVVNRSRKSPEEKSSDLCVKAFDDLKSQSVGFELSEIECCVVVTQNPDFNIPHTSAIVHESLELSEECACFDISLGCSGYVYALSVVSSFMKDNHMKKGLVFTSDPYSEVIDEQDRDTALIFGDAATVTLLSDEAEVVPLGFDFGSKGAGYKNLINDGKLHMNGRAVFNFAASKVPISVNKLLDKLKLQKTDISKWYFHQGSKYIVDTIGARLEIDSSEVVFNMYEYGNTVSSSIPILLRDDLEQLKKGSKIVLSGFGVGLSWASAVLEKIK